MIHNQGEIEKFVYSKIAELSQSINQSATTATLAKLRRGVGKEPGSQPELWEYTYHGLPESLQGKGDEPSRAERSVHSALTLFALHQQGKYIRENCMNEKGRNLGKAMRQFINLDSTKELATTRRFLTAVTSDSYEELVWHLRGLVQLLRSKDVQLDYPQLAEQLFRFQIPGSREGIRMNWGRFFYRSYTERIIKEEL